MSDEKRRRMNARDIALWSVRDRAGNVTAHVDRLAGEHAAGTEDRSLARELAMGVVRHKATLEAVVASLLDKPERRLPGTVPDIMALGLYQILFLDRVPAFAAVDEAVRQAIRGNHRRQSGLVNGVLRSAARLYEQRQSGTPPLEANVIPVSPAGYYVSDRQVFADPGKEPIKYLAQAYSLPDELARRWIERFGGLEGAAALAMHANSRPPMIARANSLKTGADSLVAKLTEQGVAARAHDNGVSVVVDDAPGMLASEAFAEGLLQPQDPTATAVGLAAGPAAGEKVLDLCAAPGTKTTHLAELMGDSGEIVASDLPRKLDLIEDNCRRMGISIVRTIAAEQLGSLEPESFDLVLVDAPCSNTGVLARRAEAKWRFDEKRLGDVVRDQHFLIAAGAAFVRRGGRLVYTTCSLEGEEGPEVAERLLRKRPDLTLAQSEFTMPDGAADPTKWCDGGYTAVFEA